MIKIIVAGGRDFDDAYRMDCLVGYYLDSIDPGGTTEFEIVSGMAKGADALGVKLAIESWYLPVKEFPADWETYGKAAGHVRNHEMAKYADVLIAFWDGKSKGTRGMIKAALAEGLEVHVYRYGEK